MVTHPIVIVCLRKIPVSRIGQKQHEHIIGGKLPGVGLHPRQRPCKRHAGRLPAKQAFFRGKPARHPHRLPIRYLHKIVRQIEIHICSQHVLADPFRQVGINVAWGDLPGMEISVVDRAIGINANNLHIRVPLFEIA